MLAGADHFADLGQVQVHRRGVAGGQNQRGALAITRADGAEDIGRRMALVLRRRGLTATPRLAAGDAVLLADAGLVGEPDLYRVGAEALLARDAASGAGKFF